MKWDELLKGISEKCDKLNDKIKRKPKGSLFKFVRPKLSKPENSGTAIAAAQKKAI